MIRFAALATLTLSMLAVRTSGATDDDPARAVARTAATDLARIYVYPSRGKAAATLLRTRAAAGAYDRLGKDALAVAITRDVASVLHDKHVRVDYASDVNAPDGAPGTGPSPEERAEMAAVERYFGYGLGRVDHLPGNVGYIEIRGFVGSSPARDAVVDAMVDAVAYSDAVIVDLRRNGGGDPATVARFLSHFLAPKTHLNDFIGRGDGVATVSQSTYTTRVPGRAIDAPLYVLTSSHTFSAAEEFAYDLLALRRGTLVGEVTGGGANPGGTHRIDDHFSIFVPDARARNPITHTNWEGRGVRPNVLVGARRALATAYGTILRAQVARATDTTIDHETLRDLATKIAAMDDASILAL